MRIITNIAFWLTVIGALNWGLIGIFDFNLVGSIFGEMSLLSRLIYILVGVSGIWLIYDMFRAPEIIVRTDNRV